MKKMPLIISMLVILTALFFVSCESNSPKPNTYIVTFDSDGGSKVDSVTVEEGNKVTKPVDPTKQGFSFEGWLDSAGKVFDFDTKITSNITLKAQWSAIKKNIHGNL